MEAFFHMEAKWRYNNCGGEVIGRERDPLFDGELVYAIDFQSYPELQGPIQQVDYFHGVSRVGGGIMSQLVI